MLLIGLLNDQSIEGLIIEDHLGIQISIEYFMEAIHQETSHGSKSQLLTTCIFSSISPRHQKVIYCGNTSEPFDIKLLFSLSLKQFFGLSYFLENRGVFGLSTVCVLLLRDQRRFDDCSGVLHHHNGSMTLSKQFMEQ